MADSTTVLPAIIVSSKGNFMRGPGYKVTGDVRRTWRCAKCGFERKLVGDVTSLMCRCQEGAWMQIVSERTNIPRPIQRPSDVERHPIDFGIEPPPPAPPKVGLPDTAIEPAAPTSVNTCVPVAFPPPAPTVS